MEAVSGGGNSFEDEVTTKIVYEFNLEPRTASTIVPEFDVKVETISKEKIPLKVEGDTVNGHNEQVCSLFRIQNVAKHKHSSP